MCANRLAQVVCVLLTLTVAIGCGSPRPLATTASSGIGQTASPSTTPTPVATPTSTPDPAIATAVSRVFPAAGLPCGEGVDRYTGCPLSARLSVRIAQNPTPQGTEPLCRCQNQYRRSMINSVTQPSSTSAMVNITLDFGLVSSQYDVSLVNQSGWVVDDVMCASRTDTSLYAARPGLC